MLFRSNSPQYLEALFGIWHAGLVAVPVNARLHRDEIKYILEHSSSSLVLTDDEHADDVDPLVAEVATLQASVRVPGPEWPALVGSAPAPVADRQGDDPAWLFYTSGTTGRPKGATLTHRNLLMASLSYFADIDPISPDDSILHAAPLSHGSGMWAIAALARGAHNVVLPGSFEPDRVYEAIKQYRHVSMFAAPTMVVRIHFLLFGTYRHDGWSTAPN